MATLRTINDLIRLIRTQKPRFHVVEKPAQSKKQLLDLVQSESKVILITGVK